MVCQLFKYSFVLVDCQPDKGNGSKPALTDGKEESAGSGKGES